MEHNTELRAMKAHKKPTSAPHRREKKSTLNGNGTETPLNSQKEKDAPRIRGKHQRKNKTKIRTQRTTKRNNIQ